MCTLLPFALRALVDAASAHRFKRHHADEGNDAVPDAALMEIM